MRGRKPHPTKLKLLKGNPGHRPMPPDEPRPPANIPKCPSFLDKGAKKEWKRMATQLDDLGMITDLDLAVLAKYCESYSQWAQASKKIQEMGMIFKTPGTRTIKPDGTVKETGAGLPIINPFFKIANKAKEQMEKSATEMGCTPSSRARVKVGEQKPKEQSRKERFFN
jgi:P27 family predicted phage terminase small subunit